MVRNNNKQVLSKYDIKLTAHNDYGFDSKKIGNFTPLKCCRYKMNEDGKGSFSLKKHNGDDSKNKKK